MSQFTPEPPCRSPGHARCPPLGSRQATERARRRTTPRCCACCARPCASPTTASACRGGSSASAATPATRWANAWPRAASSAIPTPARPRSRRTAMRFSHAPLVVAVIARLGPDEKIPESGTLAAAPRCVCFALLQAAQAAGFGAQWLTGWPAYDAEVARWLGLRRPRAHRRLHPHRHAEAGRARTRAPRSAYAAERLDPA